MSETGRPVGCGTGRTRRRVVARPAPHQGQEPVTPPGAGPHPTATSSLAGVVTPGAVVGVDESDLVHGLLDALVAARPARVGTTSLAALVALTARPEARTGALAVRLFGGELRAGTTAFGGERALRGVTATTCDVALVGGRLVGDTVWVPEATRPERLALLLSARAAYVVLAPADARPLAADATPLARLADFDGVVPVPPPVPPAHRSDAA